MNASSSIPRIVTCHISDSVNEGISSWVLSLSQVLRNSKLIVGNSVVIFDSLLNDNSFWELFLWSFMVDSLSSSIQNFLFSVTKSVTRWVQLPVVVSILLFSWSKVAMSLSILSLELFLLGNSSSKWVQKLLSIDESGSWNTEFHFALVSLVWPVISSLVTLA